MFCQKKTIMVIVMTIFVVYLQALFLELASGLLVRSMARNIRALDGAALREGG
jgi:hypothetical protein